MSEWKSCLAECRAKVDGGGESLAFLGSKVSVLVEEIELGRGEGVFLQEFDQLVGEGEGFSLVGDEFADELDSVIDQLGVAIELADQFKGFLKGHGTSFFRKRAGAPADCSATGRRAHPPQGILTR